MHILIIQIKSVIEKVDVILKYCEEAMALDAFTATNLEEYRTPVTDPGYRNALPNVSHRQRLEPR